MTGTRRNTAGTGRVESADAEGTGVDGDGDSDGLDRRARYLARELCAGFRYHDRRERADAAAAFRTVDARQFAHLDESEAATAARAYVDALWAKDAVEAACHVGGALDRDAVGDADWSPVRTALAERADAVGMDRSYAADTTEAWRRHKAGGDYWTPMLRAQRVEFRAAVGDAGYPPKESDGRAGPGPAPVRYLLGAELHDVHDEASWEEAIRVMTPYFRAILVAHSEV